MTEKAPRQQREPTPTRPADDAGHGDSPCESAGFFTSPDLLISKVVDHTAAPADWAALERAAAADPSLWRDLACAQREHALLAREVAARLARAESVALPAPAPLAPREPRIAVRPPTRRNPWTGWLAAACLALAAAMGWLRPAMNTLPDTPGAGVRTAGWAVNNPDEAVEAYLTLGREQDRVLGELPQRVLIESRPLDGGNRFEVVYIRRFLERAKVDDLVRFTGAEDEAGRPVAVPVKAAQPAPQATDQLPWSG